MSQSRRKAISPSFFAITSLRFLISSKRVDSISEASFRRWVTLFSVSVTSRVRLCTARSSFFRLASENYFLIAARVYFSRLISSFFSDLILSNLNLRVFSVFSLLLIKYWASCNSFFSLSYLDLASDLMLSICRRYCCSTEALFSAYWDDAFDWS